MELTSTVALRVPPEMLVELALGMEEPAVIAQRHGYSAEDLAKLVGQKWFLKALSAKKKELESRGWTFQAKVAMLAEDLVIEVWQKAKESDSGSFKLDAAKFLTKVADLEPKPAQQAQPGNVPTIIIKLPAVPEGYADAHRSRSAAEESKEPPTLDLQPLNPSEPKIIENLPVPDFDLSANSSPQPAPEESPSE